MSVIAHASLALLGFDTILGGGGCLTNVGTEGAAHLLRSSPLSLVEIAEQVGYESEAAFSRAFKREYGKPPGAWRSQSGLDRIERATALDSNR